MMQTHLWGGDEGGWVPYPIALVERPAERIQGLTEMYPEYMGQMHQFTVVGDEWSMAIQNDGSMTGTTTARDHRRVGDQT